MNDLCLQITGAVLALIQQVRWKPGSAKRHLLKRRKRKHLLETATLDDYESVIRRSLNDETAEVWVYRYENIPYVTVTASIDKDVWLVMSDMKGIMETAFIVRHPEQYLKSPGYEYIGRLKEVLRL
jgi:hypothetical protein